jgi:hypothetical protein
MEIYMYILNYKIIHRDEKTLKHNKECNKIKKNKQKVLGRTNRLLYFDMTRTA